MKAFIVTVKILEEWQYSYKKKRIVGIKLENE